MNDTQGGACFKSETIVVYLLLARLNNVTCPRESDTKKASPTALKLTSTGM